MRHIYVHAALRVAAALLLSLGALWAPAAASASCLLPPPGGDPWADAEVVFIGTVTAVANGDRWATVRVEEVWRGPDQPAEVIVRGGPESNTATSVDRTYNVGIRYIFALSIADGALSDSACSGTTPADAVDIVATRPKDIRPPLGGSLNTPDGGPDLGDFAGPALVVGIVGGLLVVTVLVARRRDT